MKKINIGFVISYVGSFGPANIVYNIIKYLPKEYFNIFLIILTNNKRNNEEKFGKLGIKIINLNLSKVEGILYGKNKFKKVVLENEIAILHSHCLLSSILVSKIKNIRTLATIHCNIREDFSLAYGKIQGKIMEILYLRSLRNIKEIICCSESIKKEIERYSNLKLNYIRNGVDLSQYIIDTPKNEIRKKLNLKDSEIYFIAVGRFSERKQIYFIAKEFTKMKLENCSLILLGNSYDGKSVEEKILALNNKKIIMPGRVDNVNEYLNAADYFISASLYEGLPNSVLEACCAKLPLILSNISPHKEILNFRKNAGVIFKTKHSDDFQENIYKILKVNYLESSENSFEITSLILNAFNMSKEYQKLYLMR